MTNELVSRQATEGGPSPVPARQSRDDALMVRARQIATAPPDMLPKHYQNNPGACLMAVDWADRHDVSIFEALGEVSFNRGRATVSAVMQKRLAARHGYTTRKVEGDEQSATVAVYGPEGDELGRYTYTIETARALGINKSPVWKADPAQMLYKRATTRALEHYGPGELSPMMVEPEPVATNTVVNTVPLATGDGNNVDRPPTEPVDEPPVDEAGGDAPLPSGPERAVNTAPTADELFAAIDAAGLKSATVARHWKRGIEQIADDADLAPMVLDWINEQSAAEAE